jgi:hypothetical protein
MPDELGPAITALEKKLAEQHRAVRDTKRTINMLLKMGGQNPQYAEDDDPSSSSVRADQFYGQGLATSAAEYLAIRKQACQPDEILRALEAGGFDFDMMGWKEDDRLRAFAISLAKNTGTAGKFHRLKNGSFGLRSWYDEEFLKKAAAGANERAKAKNKAKKKKTPAKITTAGTADKQIEDASQTLCSRGCGKPPHKGGCRPLDAKGSAKDKVHLAADQTAQKEEKTA